MQLYAEDEKKNYSFIINFWRWLVTILLYIKIVCVVSIKQAWCVAVITSENNTMLLEIS